VGFFAPWFLAGLAALGLPLYLHLLKRQTTKPKAVSSLRFLRIAHAGFDAAPAAALFHAVVAADTGAAVVDSGVRKSVCESQCGGAGEQPAGAAGGG